MAEFGVGATVRHFHENAESVFLVFFVYEDVYIGVHYHLLDKCE